VTKLKIISTKILLTKISRFTVAIYCLHWLTDAGEEDGRWTIFTEIVTDMRSLKLLNFFMESAVKCILHDKVVKKG